MLSSFVPILSLLLVSLVGVQLEVHAIPVPHELGVRNVSSHAVAPTLVSDMSEPVQSADVAGHLERRVFGKNLRPRNPARHQPSVNAPVAPSTPPSRPADGSVTSENGASESGTPSPPSAPGPAQPGNQRRPTLPRITVNPAPNIQVPPNTPHSPPPGINSPALISSPGSLQPDSGSTIESFAALEEPHNPLLHHVGPDPHPTIVTSPSSPSTVADPLTGQTE